MRRSSILTLAVPIVMALLAVPPVIGWAAERCVLGEYFNATW